MNGSAYRNYYRKNMLYIDGRPCTHGNIAKFINSSRWSLFFANFPFEELSNDNDFFMKSKASRFFVVHAIGCLYPSDKLLIEHEFHRPPTSHERHLALGLPLDTPLGRKKKKLINYILLFSMGLM